MVASYGSKDACFLLFPDSQLAIDVFLNNRLLPGLVPSCQEAGIIGAVAGIIGTIQATEAIKIVLGIGQPLTNRILDFDAQKTTFREIKTKRNPKCILCGENPEITKLFEHEQQVCQLRTPGTVGIT